MAQNQQQALLNALKLELKFCELGGYKPSVPGRLPARASENDPTSMFLFDKSTGECKERSVFQDSPLCLNYGLPVREHPCSECRLIDFVPAEKRGEAVPCHHIPLNGRGDTVATLGGAGRRTGRSGSRARLASQDDSAARRGMCAIATASGVRAHCGAAGRGVPLRKEDARASSSRPETSILM